MSKNGETILAERSKQRVTQNELARRLGLMTSTIVDIEYNRIGTDEETFQRIMDALNKDCTH
jgi:transcriptional regulator with XRE-family HTH domain